MSAVLYDYWRSSACYRVRIALNLKSIAFDSQPVDLLAGEHLGDAHRRRNPQGYVPVLEVDGLRLTQSLAIIEYLDETRPEPALLPDDPAGRQRVRTLAQIIAADIHPICNPIVVRYALRKDYGRDAAKGAWMHHFVGRGLGSIEAILNDGGTGAFCHGDCVGLADICLVPQFYNARRWNIDLAAFPLIRSIERNCNALPAFSRSAPEAGT